MSSPRRYRLALRSYPARWRRAYGEDLLATLADGDDERGRPSAREAFALARHGLLLRGRFAPIAQQRILAAAAVGLLLASVLPARAWTQRLQATGDGTGMPVLDGPPQAGRILLAAVAMAVLFTVAPRRLRLPLPAFVACVAIQLVIEVGVAWSRSPSRGLHPSAGMLATAVAVGGAVALAVAFARRWPPRQRRLVCGAATIAIVVPTLIAATVLDGPGGGQSDPLMPWQLGPAGLLTLAAGAAALVGLMGATRRPHAALH